MIAGAPVFKREILAYWRRPRTYVFQAVFLGVLVVALLPFWPASQAQAGAEVADRAGLIIEWGGYIQLVLLALLAPAITANAITEEKSSNTLDLLLLTGTGPFSIALGKFISRLYILAFLLFLTLPLLFALLTLGGVSARTLLIEALALLAYAVFATGLGIFLSTVMARAVTVLAAGYVLLGLHLAAPPLLEMAQVVPPFKGAQALTAAFISPIYNVHYLFNPSRYVPTESVAHSWWWTPAWNVGAGLLLVLISGLILPFAREFERALSPRRALELIDRFTYLMLRPGLLLKGARPAQVELPREGLPNPDDRSPGESLATRLSLRAVGQANPIYWKETTVNTIGRFRHWWRANLAILVLLFASYGVFRSELANHEFHQYTVAVLAGILAVVATIVAATTVSREREDGTLLLLATTPLTCPTYVAGKVRGIARNIAFLVALPFLHVLIFAVATDVISGWSLLLLALTIPIAVACTIVQGIFVSLLFPTTLRAIMAAVFVLIVEGLLPLICCIPGFNPPMACYYMVLPGPGTPASALATQGDGFFTAILLALVFGGSTQIGFTFVIYSLIRSGFDRYIGRAA